MKKLFLDDIRKPYDQTWDLVRSYDEFVAYIEKNGCPDVISFDHDLAEEHYPFNGEYPDPTQINYYAYRNKTGYHCAQWLIEKGIFPKLAIVHSQNGVGAQNIHFILRKHCRSLIHVFDFNRPPQLVYV